MRVLVAIPALNEAGSISEVIAGIAQAMRSWEDVTVTVFDDGSTDAIPSQALAAGAEVRSHETPLGVAQVFRNAVELALEHRVDTLVMIDGDGQFDPGDIPSLLAPIMDGTADFVAADRFSGLAHRPPDMPVAKYIGNRMMNGPLDNRLSGGRCIIGISRLFT